MKNWDESDGGGGAVTDGRRGGGEVGAIAIVTQPIHQVELSQVGSRTTVPDNHFAKLSYYLSCINGLGEPFTDLFSDVPSLLQYSRTYWSSQEQDVLLALAVKLDPTVLVRTGVLMFAKPGEPILKGMSNTFISVDVKTKQNIAIASDELVAIVGREKVTKITKIMVCTEGWVTSNWMNPMEILIKKRAPQPTRSSYPPREEKSPILCHCCLCIVTACLWCPIWFCCGRKPGQCCYRPFGC